MDKKRISRTIITPPVGPDRPGNYDFEELAEAIGEHFKRLSYLGGGGTLNPMLHQAVCAGTVEAGLQRSFEEGVQEILAGGALGFGELSCEHLSFNPFDPIPPHRPIIPTAAAR